MYKNLMLERAKKANNLVRRLTSIRELASHACTKDLSNDCIGDDNSRTQKSGQMVRKTGVKSTKSSLTDKAKL